LSLLDRVVSRSGFERTAGLQIEVIIEFVNKSLCIMMLCYALSVLRQYAMRKRQIATEYKIRDCKIKECSPLR